MSIDLRIAAALLLTMTSIYASGEEPDTLESSELGRAFGSSPLMWGLRLSPDGRKMSAIQVNPRGTTLARVYDLESADGQTILAFEEEEVEVQWCGWASDTRLLCGVRGIIWWRGRLRTASRLVAVNADGSDMRVLTEDGRGDEFTQFQDIVVDWLPDDPEHVLVMLPSREGSGVSRLDINSGEFTTQENIRDGAWAWISDGRGVIRLYEHVGRRSKRWYARIDRESRDWTLLREIELTDYESKFLPIAFGESRDELLFYGEADGRTVLSALDLTSGEERVIFGHPTLDVAGVHLVGKYDRLAGATYVDASPRIEFFDARIEQIRGELRTEFPERAVTIIDESWDQRHYLVTVASDTVAGVYYLFDSAERVLTRIAPMYPALAERALSATRRISYRAKDGTEIPGNLTLPSDREGPHPIVVLTHGAFSSRDYWAAYPYLVQFLAASGYAVLQSNYRGSSGYGRGWFDDGAFRNWRRPIADIAASVNYLVDEEIADPGRICVVGWGYGGYTALMSVIEHPDGFRCVASIAGITDPRALGNYVMRFVHGRTFRELIGAGDTDVGTAGSPIERVDEIDVPVFLAHGARDLAVPFEQTNDFAHALSDRDKPHEFFEYEFAEHDIRPDRYRIDLLTRLGRFLETHLAR